MQNTNQSCWFNVLVQTLLRAGFAVTHDNPPDSFARALAVLLGVMTGPRALRVVPFNDYIEPLVKVLIGRIPDNHNSASQDPQENWRMLLELGDSGGAFTREAFEMRLVNILTCAACNRVSHQAESQVDLSMSVIDRQSGRPLRTLEDTLQAFCAAETVDINCVCGHTRKQQMCRLAQTGSVVVIHLKRRLEYRYQTVLHSVRIGARLNFHDYLIAPSEAQHLLFAVWLFLPSIAHYMVLVRDASSRTGWVKCDDSQVTDVSEAYVLEQACKHAVTVMYTAQAAMPMQLGASDTAPGVPQATPPPAPPPGVELHQTAAANPVPLTPPINAARVPTTQPITDPSQASPVTTATTQAPPAAALPAPALTARPFATLANPGPAVTFVGHSPACPTLTASLTATAFPSPTEAPEQAPPPTVLPSPSASIPAPTLEKLQATKIHEHTPAQMRLGPTPSADVRARPGVNRGKRRANAQARSEKSTINPFHPIGHHEAAAAPPTQSSLQPPAQPLPMAAQVATTYNAFRTVRGRGFERQQARSCVIDRGQSLPTQTRGEPEPFHTQTWSEDRRWPLFSALPPVPREHAPARTWCFKYEAARQGRQAKLEHKGISQNHSRASNACLQVAAHHKRQMAARQSSVEFLQVQDVELETWLNLFFPSREVCAARASAARGAMEVPQASQAATPGGQARDGQSEPLSVSKPEQFEPASNGAKTPTATAHKEWHLRKAPALKAVRGTMLTPRASTVTEVCTQHAAVLRCAHSL